MGSFEVPKFEVPKFDDWTPAAQESATSSSVKNEKSEKKSAKKTFESASTKGSKVTNPITQTEVDALWGDMKEFQDEETQCFNFSMPDDWNETIDTNNDGKTDSREIRVAKELTRQKKIKEIIIAKEEVDIIHEENVKSAEIKTEGSSIVFRDNDETTENKKIDNSNPDKQDGDFVMELDGSENAEQTVKTYGTDFFYVPSYNNSETTQKESYESTQSKLADLKVSNYTFLDETEKELKKMTPFESENLNYLFEMYLVQNNLKKENLADPTIREIKLSLLKAEREVS